jgi:outer membrane protein assembly factor BamB
LKLIAGIVLAVLTVITISEVVGVMKINMRMGKKPVVLARWKPGAESTGQTSMYINSGSLYMVDASRGTMLKYDLMTGKFLTKYSLPQGLYSVAQFSNGDLIAASAGNTLVRFKPGSDKPQAPVTAEGCSGLSFLDVDSNDNLLAVDAARNVVIKYDNKLKKISEFGGGALTGAKKAYVGPQNSVYVLDGEPGNRLSVKIFSEDGSLRKKFRVLKDKPLSGLESLAISPGGNVYINNMGGNEIYCYAPSGKILGHFGSTADNPAVMTYPSGIAGTTDGKLFVPTYEWLVLQDIKY